MIRRSARTTPVNKATIKTPEEKDTYTFTKYNIVIKVAYKADDVEPISLGTLESQVRSLINSISDREKREQLSNELGTCLATIIAYASMLHSTQCIDMREEGFQRTTDRMIDEMIESIRKRI